MARLLKKSAPSVTPGDVVKVRMPQVDVDSFSETLTPEQRDELFKTPDSATKPDISNLPNAIDVFGQPAFTVGDKIVIERYAHILPGQPYLDTKSYKVLEVDDVTGDMRLYDETLSQFAMENWKIGTKRGNVYKLAMGNVISRKQRGRPRKNPIEAPKPLVVGPDGKPIKKKRGRPPGTKNRPTEVIAAIKEARRLEKAQKKAKK